MNSANVKAWECSVDVNDARLVENVRGDVVDEVMLCCGGVAVPLDGVYACEATELRRDEAVGGMRAEVEAWGRLEARPNIWSICGRSCCPNGVERNSDGRSAGFISIALFKRLHAKLTGNPFGNLVPRQESDDVGRKRITVEVQQMVFGGRIGRT